MFPSNSSYVTAFADCVSDMISSNVIYESEEENETEDTSLKDELELVSHAARDSLREYFTLQPTLRALQSEYNTVLQNLKQEQQMNSEVSRSLSEIANLRSDMAIRYITELDKLVQTREQILLNNSFTVYLHVYGKLAQKLKLSPVENPQDDFMATEFIELQKYIQQMRSDDVLHMLTSVKSYQREIITLADKLSDTAKIMHEASARLLFLKEQDNSLTSELNSLKSMATRLNIHTESFLSTKRTDADLLSEIENLKIKLHARKEEAELFDKKLSEH